MPPKKNAPTTGDGGAREDEVSKATQDLEDLARSLNLGDDPGKVVAVLTEHFLEVCKRRPKPWSELSNAEQRDVLRSYEANAKEVVRQVVEMVAREGRSAVRCLMVGFTDKGDDITVQLKVKAGSREDTEAAVLSLHRARGKFVLLTVASADDYHETAANDVSEPDQRGLEFDAGIDNPPPPPADDSDLVEAAERMYRDGDAMTLADGTNGRVRVDLKSGWVQFLADNHADMEINWQDVGEATPEELAAERGRIADFDDGAVTVGQLDARTVEA